MRTALPLSFFLLLLVSLEPSSALKMTEVNIPKQAGLGKRATLECEYDLEGARLKQVRWSIGTGVFYRYDPRKEPEKEALAVPAGLTVDLEASGSTRVVLDKIGRSASGRYRCEVSDRPDAEGATPQIVSAERDMLVVDRLEDEDSRAGAGASVAFAAAVTNFAVLFA